MGERLVPDTGKASLWERWRGLTEIGQDETGPDWDRAHRLC
jgi:hypothetical protein